MKMRKGFNLKDMMQSFRMITLFGVVLLGGAVEASSKKSLKSLYISRDYKALASRLDQSSKKLSFKEYAYLIVAYKYTGEFNKLIHELKKAVKIYPEKDVLQRELALAHEARAKSYSGGKILEKVKVQHHVEAVNVLENLKNKKPTAENLTAFINYYFRQNNYAEAQSLLELYARENIKGKNYYTMLCESHYKSSMYEAAKESCGELVRKYNEGHLRHAKSLSQIGEKKIAERKIVRLAKRFPASAEIQLEAGKILIEKGAPRRALQMLEKHIKMDPSDEALVLKAEELYKLKKYKASLKAYIQACKQHKEPRRNLITKLKSAGRQLGKKHPLKKAFLNEVNKCKYVYKPKRKKKVLYNSRR